MSLSPDELTELAACASDAARRAGALVSTSRPALIEEKAVGQSEASRIVTEVDRKSQALVLETLRDTIGRFDLGLLCEESADDGSRFAKDYFWSIDPLDGTLPFVEAVFGYAISIALVSRDGIPVIGVVFDPVEDTLYRAIRDQGITRNETRWAPALPGSGPLTIFADRSFKSHSEYDAIVSELEKLSQEMGGALDLRIGAGAVMNACKTLTHAPACYFKFPKAKEGGGSLWDFAATACLFHESRALATDIHGNGLDLNREGATFMNHRGVCFATSDDLARRIRALFLA